MLNFDVPGDVMPSLSTIITRNQHARSAAGGGESKRRRRRKETARKLAEGCKSRLVVLGQDAFPECVGVEHPFDALHSGVSEAGGDGRGQEGGGRVVSAGTRKVA